MRPTPTSCRTSSRANPRTVARRDVDFGVRANRLAIGGRVLDLFTPHASYDDVFLALHGAHQADNAALALTAAESFLGRALDPELVADAFRAVRTPGRLEVVGHQPLVLLDGVKNVAGARALRAALAEEFADSPRTLVVGLDAREGTARDARGARRASTRRASCVADPTARVATIPTSSPTRPTTSGSSTASVDVIDDVRDAVTFAIDVDAGRRPGRDHRFALRGEPGPRVARRLKALRSPLA